MEAECPLIVFLKAHPDFNARLRNTVFPAASLCEWARSWEGEAETQKALLWLVGTYWGKNRAWGAGGWGSAVGGFQVAGGIIRVGVFGESCQLGPGKGR